LPSQAAGSNQRLAQSWRGKFGHFNDVALDDRTSFKHIDHRTSRSRAGTFDNVGRAAIAIV
jgi:hypothetical protein